MPPINPLPPQQPAGIDDATARAMQKVAESAQLLAQAADRPAIRQAGSMFEDIGRSIQASRQFLTFTAPAVAGYTAQIQRQGRAFADATGMARQFEAVQRRAMQAQEQSFQKYSSMARQQSSVVASMSMREIGAQISRRAKEAADALAIQLGGKRAEVKGTYKTLAQQGYGESIFQGEGGDKAKIARQAREVSRRQLAERVKSTAENALLDTMATKGLSDHTANGNAAMFRMGEVANWSAVDKAARLRHAETQRRMRMEMGGEGAGPGDPGAGNADDVALLRRRQRRAIAGAVKADYSEQLRDLRLQNLADAATQGYLSTDEGEKNLAEQTRRKQQKALNARTLGLTESRARLALGETSEGQDNLRGQVGQEMTKETQDAKEVLQLEKERQKFLKSPEGRQALREQGKAERELGRIMEENQKRQRAGKMTLFQRGVEGLESLEKQLAGLGSVAQNVFGVVTTGAIGLASMAGQFDHFPTLMASAKALGIELGASFLPVLDNVSRGLQSAASWVRALDASQKTNIARVAIWVAAGGLMVSVCYKAVIAVRTLAVAMGSLTAATGVGAIMLAAGAVAALAGEYYLLGQNASTAAHAVGGVTDAGLRRAGLGGMARKAENALGSDDFGGMDEPFKKLAMKYRGTPQALAEVLYQYREKTAAELATMKKKQPAGLIEAAGRDERVDKALAPMYERGRHIGLGAQDQLQKARSQSLLGSVGQSLWKGDGLKSPEARLAELTESLSGKAGDLARGQFREAAEALEKAGVKMFYDYPKRAVGTGYHPDIQGQRMNQDEIARRMAAGEVSASSVYSRLYQTYLHGKPERAEGTAVDRKVNSAFNAVEAKLKTARDLFEKAGGEDSLKRAFRSPIQPGIMSASAYSDRLTTASLKMMGEGDQEAMNFARLVELMSTNNNIQTQVLEELKKEGFKGPFLPRSGSR